MSGMIVSVRRYHARGDRQPSQSLCSDSCIVRSESQPEGDRQPSQSLFSDSCNVRSDSQPCSQKNNLLFMDCFFGEGVDQLSWKW